PARDGPPLPPRAAGRQGTARTLTLSASLAYRIPGHRTACGAIVGSAESIDGELPMLFTCRPPGTPIPGRFPGPAHARGKWFTVDIHCHIRSDKATAMVAGNQDVSRWFLETAADERSQRINRENGERTY